MLLLLHIALQVSNTSEAHSAMYCVKVNEKLKYHWIYRKLRRVCVASVKYS